MSWAKEHADRMVSDELVGNGFPDGHDDLGRVVGNAIKEALEKAAAESCFCSNVYGAHDCPSQKAIRALMEDPCGPGCQNNGKCWDEKEKR